MSLHSVKNNCFVELTGNVNDSQTTISLVSSAILPTPPFYLTFTGTPMEIIEVTNIVGNDITVTRGVLGTIPSAHSSITRLELRVMAQHITEVVQLYENVAFKDKENIFTENQTIQADDAYALLVNNGDNTHSLFVVDTVNKQVIFNGDIIQNGEPYETHAQKLYTAQDLIITRDGAVSGLLAGEYTGIQAKLYDGVNDGQLVFDNTGTARVGDIDSKQALATREDAPLDNGVAVWDNATTKFETNSNLTFDSTTKKLSSYELNLSKADGDVVTLGMDTSAGNRIVVLGGRASGVGNYGELSFFNTAYSNPLNYIGFQIGGRNCYLRCYRGNTANTPNGFAVLAGSYISMPKVRIGHTSDSETTTQTQALNVNGTSQFSGASTFSPVASTNTIVVTRVGGYSSICSQNQDLMLDSYGGAGNNIEINWFSANDVNIVRGGGKLAIGHDAPTEKLDVNGNILTNSKAIVKSDTAELQIKNTAETETFQILKSSGAIDYKLNAGVQYWTTNTARQMSFAQNGTVRIFSKLKVGENAEPSEALDVKGNIKSTGTITGSNLSGTNTGDETTATIKTKLGTASTSTDGYLTSTDWNTFNGKENSGTASGLMSTHESTYVHSDIAHTNRNSLDLVEGTNTGDETKSTIESKLTGTITSHDHNGTYEPVFTKNTAFNKNFETLTDNIKMDGIVSVGTSSNIARADHIHPTDTSREASGTASGLMTTHESTYVHSDIAHTNRAALNNVSGTNTGDETVDTIKTKLGTASTSTDGYLTSANWNTFNNKEPAITKNTAFNKNFETSTTNIKMNGAVSVGTSSNIARADHVHPVDTSREASGTASGLMTTHESTYVHSDIAHVNRSELDLVSGTNTGDETKTTIETKLTGLITSHTHNYEPTLTKGNLTESTSSVLTISGGTGAVIGTGTTIQVKQANTSQGGFLSSTDWNTFNGKEPAITKNTAFNKNFETSTANIKMNGTVSVGELSTIARADHVHPTDTTREPTLTKGNLTETNSNILTITGGTGSVIGTGTSIQVNQSSTSSSGYLSSTDWNTFNGKQDSLGYTAENTANKKTSFQATPTDTAYPSEKLVKDSLDLKANDSDVVKLTGTQTIAGLKTFSDNVTLSSELKFGSVAKISSASGSNVELNNGSTNAITISGATSEVTFNKNAIFKTLSLVIQTLSISFGSVSWNVSNGSMANLTLTANVTLNSPTNVPIGSTLKLIVKQDTTGGRLITWNANYKFPGGIKPVLTSTASATDIFEFLCLDSGVFALTNFVSDVK